MILVLIKSTDSFTIYDENLVRRLTTMLFNFYWLCPNPKTLRKFRRYYAYFGAWIYSWTNPKSSLISFVEDYTIQKEWLACTIFSSDSNDSYLFSHSSEQLFSVLTNLKTCAEKWVKYCVLTFLCIISDQVDSSTFILWVHSLFFFTDFTKCLHIFKIILFRCISKHHFIILVYISTASRSIGPIFEASTSFVILVLLILAKPPVEIIVDIMTRLLYRRPH